MRDIVRNNPCILCGELVVECVEEHPCAYDAIPDQSNCDFSAYKNYRIIGGILLNKRRITPLRNSTVLDTNPVVCDACLTDTKINTLVSWVLSVLK